jgi:hypothetical protein
MLSGIESGRSEDENKEEGNEEEKQIDDVYDVNAVKSNYELQCLRKEWTLDFMKIMEMID